MSVHFSHNKDEWETPWEFFNELDKEFHFTLDVCASDANHKCHEYWTEAHDGLTQNWRQNVCWMNPPYSNLRDWMREASASAKAGATVVCLIPSRTDTIAWHTYVWDAEHHRPRPGVEVRFVKGRLKFGSSKNSAPFPSAVVIFRPPRPDPS